MASEILQSFHSNVVRIPAIELSLVGFKTARKHHTTEDHLEALNRWGWDPAVSDPIEDENELDEYFDELHHYELDDEIAAETMRIKKEAEAVTAAATASGDRIRQVMDDIMLAKPHGSFFPSRPIPLAPVVTPTLVVRREKKVVQAEAAAAAPAENVGTTAAGKLWKALSIAEGVCTAVKNSKSTVRRESRGLVTTKSTAVSSKPSSIANQTIPHASPRHQAHRPTSMRASATPHTAKGRSVRVPSESKDTVPVTSRADSPSASMSAQLATKVNDPMMPKNIMTALEHSFAAHRCDSQQRTNSRLSQPVWRVQKQLIGSAQRRGLPDNGPSLAMEQRQGQRIRMKRSREAMEARRRRAERAAVIIARNVTKYIRHTKFIIKAKAANRHDLARTKAALILSAAVALNMEKANIFYRDALIQERLVLRSAKAIQTCFRNFKERGNKQRKQQGLAQVAARKVKRESEARAYFIEWQERMNERASLERRVLVDGKHQGLSWQVTQALRKGLETNMGTDEYNFLPPDEMGSYVDLSTLAETGWIMLDEGPKEEEEDDLDAFAESLRKKAEKKMGPKKKKKKRSPKKPPKKKNEG